MEESVPIYHRLAEQLSAEILAGSYPEDTQVPSTNELALFHRINPATAGKALNLLVAQGVLIKRRGIGMFVAPGACELLRERRRESLGRRLVEPLVAEAQSLGLTRGQLQRMLDDAWSAPAPLTAASDPSDDAPTTPTGGRS